jgi:hypothetical protein
VCQKHKYLQEVLDALEQVGVLQQGADRFSVEKIARFFLDEFTKTIEAGGKWLSQLDKEEQKRIRLTVSASDWKMLNKCVW